MILPPSADASSKSGRVGARLQQPGLNRRHPPLGPALGRLPGEHRIGNLAVDGHRGPLFGHDDIVTHPHDLLQLPREMIGLRQPKFPASLVLHDADFDVIKLFVADLFGRQARDAVKVRLQRIGVAVEGAGIEDRHAQPGPEIACFMADRMATGRRGLRHVGGGPRLVVRFVFVIAEGASLRPVDPEPATVADEDAALAPPRRLRFDAEIVGLLEPRLVRASDRKVSLSFHLVVADVGKRFPRSASRRSFAGSRHTPQGRPRGACARRRLGLFQGSP